MTKIILTIDGRDILGSDGLMYIDGRKNLYNQILEVKKRNKTYAKNFPNKVANGFYKVNDRLQRISSTITFNRIN